MVNSMTGFAAGDGRSDGWRWSWELRSVNARGLDLRLRVPDWLPGLEQSLRKTLGQALGRGNVTLNLRLSRDEETASSINMQVLEQVLARLGTISDSARSAGVSVAPPSLAELAAMPGVMDAPDPDAAEVDALRTTVLADFDAVLAAFRAMRADEGRALAAVIAGQIDSIAANTEDAAALAAARSGKAAETLRRNLDRIVQAGDVPDAQRVAQELALLAVKSDVTEELDRLRAHVAAARDLLAAEGPVGRKLDFLAQEFNREANTLCSKAGDPDLTRVGLDLKAAIDQMREQVQNVE